jgi:hypothetical protein
MASLVAVPSTESRDESPCDVATEARYLPEVDAEIAHVAAELAREQEALPWALQVHSLRYDVSSLSAPWGPVIAEHGARWLFDLLLTIGSRGEANESQLDRRLKQLVPGGVTSRLGAALASSSLLRALEPLDLVYPTAAGKRRTAEDTPASRASADAGQRWRLTEKAQELTAEAFACQRANAAPNAAAVVELLKEQNPAYQAALVRTASALDAAHLEAVVRSVRPLSPAGLKEAVLRLAGLAGEDATRRHVAALLETECSPWLRKAACETLASLGSARDVAPLLARIVKSDTSAAVRAAARQVADRSSLTLRLDAVAAPRSEPLALGPAEATVS